MRFVGDHRVVTFREEGSPTSGIESCEPSPTLEDRSKGRDTMVAGMEMVLAQDTCLDARSA